MTSQRSAESDEIDRSLSQLDDPNPFDWISAGQNAYDANEFRRAIGFFRKGADHAPYVHEAHFGLAKAKLVALGENSVSQ